MYIYNRRQTPFAQVQKLDRHLEAAGKGGQAQHLHLRRFGRVRLPGHPPQHGKPVHQEENSTPDDLGKPRLPLHLGRPQRDQPKQRLLAKQWRSLTNQRDYFIDGHDFLPTTCKRYTILTKVKRINYLSG